MIFILDAKLLFFSNIYNNNRFFVVCALSVYNQCIHQYLISDLGLRLSFFSKLAVVVVFRCSSVKNLA